MDNFVFVPHRASQNIQQKKKKEREREREQKRGEMMGCVRNLG
jgi:hypothetical protein